MPTPAAQEPWKISKNQHLYSIHVLDAASFAGNVDARLFPGDSVMLDFPYFLHPVRPGGDGTPALAGPAGSSVCPGLEESGLAPARDAALPPRAGRRGPDVPWSAGPVSSGREPS